MVHVQLGIERAVQFAPQHLFVFRPHASNVSRERSLYVKTSIVYADVWT